MDASALSGWDAGLGAVLAQRTAEAFATGVAPLGIAHGAALNMARRLSAGDVGGAVSILPDGVREAASAVGRTAFAQGFSAAVILAAAVAVIAGLLAVWLVSGTETAPVTVDPALQAKASSSSLAAQR